MLNPDQSPFCIGDLRNSVDLPIRINQTNPILIEILRIDLDTNRNETITLSAKDINKLKRQAKKGHEKNNPPNPLTLRYAVKKTGLYRLQRVIDESKLDVRRRPSDTLVVGCPVAMVQVAPHDKCIGDLSDFRIRVDATPPLRIKFSKTLNRVDNGNVVLSIHPEGLITPLARQRTSGALVPLEAADGVDVSWARARSIDIPLNESLGVGGGWHYVIDEIHDACGNVANYSNTPSLDQSQRKLLKGRQWEQRFFVHDRPQAALRGCDSQHPIKVEKGKSKSLSIQVSPAGTGKLEDTSYRVTYLFTPQEDILPDQKHPGSAMIHELITKDLVRGLEVSEPGLYTLRSMSTEFCGGEVIEPSSCLLLNPPEPDLTITSETIPDKCAGNSIGVMVNIDLYGTPPFHISYDIRQTGGQNTPKTEIIDRLHTQLELKPPTAGHYVYEITNIKDAVYTNPRSLGYKRLVIEQDVKPPAVAHILDAHRTRQACIEEPVTFPLELSGEPPYKLDYELVHRGQRKRHTIDGIHSKIFMLTTESLNQGGEYILALSSITDRSECKIFLKEEAKADVGLQRPRAAFGHFEGKRNISAVEAKQVGLPLRLQGEPPWTLTFRNNDDKTGSLMVKTLQQSNDKIDVDAEGTFEILDVHDATCPGSIEISSSQFTVRRIPRPSIQIAENAMITYTTDMYIRKEVCEGDEDITELSFTGTAPFDVEFEQHLKSQIGLKSVSTKTFTAGLNVAFLRMETSEAGSYQYKFTKLGDASYSHDRQKFSPLIVLQQVHGRPLARFTEAYKTYKYCHEEETGDEIIPITLTGLPPFQLELDIRHQSTVRSEVVNVPSIISNHYDLHIPHRFLALGTHSVTIRNVKDSRGCQRKTDLNAPHVQVSVADVPSISPMEAQTDYCVGERISYTLSGSPPFNVFYTFRGHERKAAVPSTEFRRIAENPGLFVINAVSDYKSTETCKTKVELKKVIHEMPSVRVSKGRTNTVDIHEGGEAEILFEFGGSPPFHFT